MKGEINKSQTIGCSLSQGGKINCSISGGSTVSGSVQNKCTPQPSVVERGPEGKQGPIGPRGPSGVEVSITQPTDPAVEVWLNPNGTQGKTSQLINDGEGTEPFITDSDVGNGTITFTQEGSTIGTITTNQKTNSTIAIGQSGTKVIWRIWE